MIYFTECLSDTGAKTTLQRLLLELTLDDESVERQWFIDMCSHILKKIEFFTNKYKRQMSENTYVLCMCAISDLYMLRSTAQQMNGRYKATYEDALNCFEKHPLNCVENLPSNSSEILQQHPLSNVSKRVFFFQLFAWLQV